MLKVVLAAGASIGTLALAAAPSVTEPDVSVGENGVVTIGYRLAGDSAVVTADVTTNGVSIGAEHLRGFVGDVNREMEPGDHVIHWCPRNFWPNERIADGSLKIRLTAWSKADPPDYLAQSIHQKDLRFFYPTAGEVPGGVTNRAYKTNLLLMRRMRAAGVPWTAGLSANDPKYTSSTRYLARVVTLTNDYYIGVFETTVAQFKMVVGGVETPTAGLFNSQFTNAVLFARPDTFVRPIDSVSWCRLRCNTTGSHDSYCWPQKGHAVHSSSPTALFRQATGLQVDLPTEAQWEFAARAGEPESMPADSDAVAWTESNWRNDPMRVAYGNENGSHEVGLLAPNAFGLYDMMGNGYEWCLDAMTDDSVDPYAGAETIEPVGPELTMTKSGDSRVVRGGSFATAIGYGWRTKLLYSRYYREQGFRYVCPAVLP